MELKSIAIVLLVVIIISFGGYLGYQMLKGSGPTSSIPSSEPIIITQPPSEGGGGGGTYSPNYPPNSNVPVQNLTVSVKDKFTMTTLSSPVSVNFYVPGSDISDPYIQPLESSIFSNGIGKINSSIIQTNTLYDVYFNGSNSYYDEKLADTKLNFNPETGRGYLIIDGLSYFPATKVGTFVNWSASLPEVQPGVDQTGYRWQNTVTFIAHNGTFVRFGNATDPAPVDECVANSASFYNLSGKYNITSYFTQVGCTARLNNNTYNRKTIKVNYTAQVYEFIEYDESLLDGSMWFRLDIGNDAANSELKNVVMCFSDADGDMENNEVTAFTATYVSGTTAINIPGNLITYWQDAMGGSGPQCFQIANMLGSSEKARWEFTITIDENQFDSTEEFEMIVDDLGNYKAKQYPSRNMKATPQILIIGDQD